MRHDLKKTDHPGKRVKAALHAFIIFHGAAFHLRLQKRAVRRRRIIMEASRSQSSPSRPEAFPVPFCAGASHKYPRTDFQDRIETAFAFISKESEASGQALQGTSAILRKSEISPTSGNGADGSLPR